MVNAFLTGLLLFAIVLKSWKAIYFYLLDKSPFILNGEPVEVEYQGEIYKLHVVHEALVNPFPGTLTSRTVVYINGTAAMTISRMRPMIFTRRVVDLNVKSKKAEAIITAARRLKEMGN